MATYRCSICGISYPGHPYREHSRCTVCGTVTAYFSDAEPDTDWAEKVAYGLARRDQAEALQEEIPRVAGELNIYEEHGLFWVNQTDLIQAGIRMNIDQADWLFSAQGHIWEAQSWDEPRRRWWIQELSLDVPVAV